MINLSKMSNIVVVGSCCIDMISYVKKLPNRGETLQGNKFITGFGGKGANQVIAAARLGGKTSFIARLGDDNWGVDYSKKLAEETVDITYVTITKGETTGIAQIAVEDSGENHIIIISGANGKLCVDDVMKANDVVANATVLLLQLEIPVDSTKKAMRICNGISILNGAPAVPNCDCTLLKAPTIFCVNETELSVFTGMPVNNLDEIKLALDNLLKRGCKSVLVTLGANGVLYASQEKPEPIHVPAAKVTPVDTTGAGDSFIGSLAYMLANRSDLSMEKCIEVASRLATISITRLGANISYPNKDVLQEILTELGLSK